MDMMPDGDRYARMPLRRTGRSGLMLPAMSLGLWQNFGGDRPIETQRAIIRRASDLGITHFDLAHNYGPPYGFAESNRTAQRPRSHPNGSRRLRPVPASASAGAIADAKA